MPAGFEGMAGESAVGALLFPVEHGMQDFHGVGGRAGVRGYLKGCPGASRKPIHAMRNWPILDGDAAGFREHRLRIALAHDGLVDVAQDRVEAVELPDALRRPPLLCNVNEGGDGVRFAVKVDERRAQKDLADFAVARPDHRLRIVQGAVGFEAGSKIRYCFFFHEVQFSGGVTGDVFGGSSRARREKTELTSTNAPSLMRLIAKATGQLRSA